MIICKHYLLHNYVYRLLEESNVSAITKLNKSGSRKIFTRYCSVYGEGMSRLSLLARQHNEINQIQRATTFPEVAASCRRLIYAHFATNDGVDDGEYMPEVPRYGKLKGQKTHSMTAINILKALEGKFSADLQHFQPFQGSKVSILCAYKISHIC